jgi:hypothetical protein
VAFFTINIQMLFTLLAASLVGLASAGFGPMGLYNAIEGTTLTFGSYAVNPYLSVQYQNLSYGNFDTYVAENNMYTYQRYVGGSASGCAAPRTMKLYIACGSPASLGPVSEPTACNYQAIMEIPQACGVSFAVGNELMSPTPMPSANATAIVAASSSLDGYIGMILGAVGVSGVGVVIAIQVYNSMKNKGGLSQLFKAHTATIDKAMNKLPVPDSVKKSIKSVAEKQIDRLDAEIDKKMKTTRSKIAELEGRKYEEDIELDIIPKAPPRRQSTEVSIAKPKTPTVDLDAEPVRRVVARSPTPEPVRKIVERAPSPEPVRKAVARSPTPEPVRKVASPEPVRVEVAPPMPEPEAEKKVDTAKLEISLTDLEEIKALLQRRNKTFAVAE